METKANTYTHEGERDRERERERERERLIIEKKVVKDIVVKGLQQTSQHVTSWVLE